MKRIVDKEELRVYWQLEKWYEKTAYVIGVSVSLFWVACFVSGVISAITEL